MLLITDSLEEILRYMLDQRICAFMVHSDVVPPHSIVLGRLVDGSFKEGIERCADLPEVDAAMLYSNSSQHHPARHSTTPACYERFPSVVSLNFNW